MTETEEAHSLRSVPTRVKVMLGILGSTAALLGVLGVAAFVVAASRTVPPLQPVDITACRPETYQAPTGTEEGPKQSDCSRWFDSSGQRMQSARTITIAGQVCLDHDEPVAYEVTVAWEALLDDTRLVVLQTPLTWDPGCAEPYSFGYSFPEFATDNSETGESLGRWRLVGRAEPVDPSRFAPYQWDATGSVEVIAG